MEEILTLSNSQTDVWDRCEFRWYFNYDQGLVPVFTKRHFQLGTFVHKLLEIHFQAKRNGIRDTWPLIVEYANSYDFDRDEIKNLNTFMRGLRIVERYIREFAPKNDHFRILDTERHFIVEMLTQKGRPYRLQGYFDLLVELDSKLWIVDHKSTSTGSFWNERQLLRDPQMTTYILGLREQGYKVFGCMINQLNTYDYAKFENEPITKLFRRERIFRTDAEIKSMATNLGKIADEIYDRGGEYRKSYRRDCDKCPYFVPCLYHDKKMDLSAELKTSFKKRDVRPIEPEENGDAVT